MKDRFHNKITYAKKWDTKANIEKANLLYAKYPTDGWSDCPCSWIDEVTELLDSIKEKYSHVEFDQYKEKFGTLRVYYRNYKSLREHKKISKMIDKCQVKLVRKLKYPYPMYRCAKCKNESIYYTKTKRKNLICCVHCRTGKLRTINNSKRK